MPYDRRYILTDEPVRVALRRSIQQVRVLYPFAIEGWVLLPDHMHCLWQRRFWEHQIRDETDYRRHRDYLHWNPVKHGYVRSVADWPYFSFHRYARGGVLPLDWGGGYVPTAGVSGGLVGGIGEFAPCQLLGYAAFRTVRIAHHAWRSER